MGGHGESTDFPMFTVFVETLLQMTTLLRHEVLLAQGKLHEFQERMGRAMFVSHQWLSCQHPDPCGAQLQVLQKALLNLMEAKSSVSLPPVVELYVGRVKCPEAKDFQEPLYLWYDYFSCPQNEDQEAVTARKLAIKSIPCYVEQCFFFAASHDLLKTKTA